MENQNKFKLRLSRMFRSSFGSSCRSKNISDVIESAVFIDNVPQNNTTFHFLEHQENQQTQTSPKTLFPSICKPRPCPNHPKDTINNSCIVSAKSILNPGRKHHPNPFPHFSLGLIPNVQIPKAKDFHVKTKRNKTPRKKKKRNYTSNRPLSSSSLGSFNLDDWYSSDDERESSSEDDETDTLFSSRTLSSDSSGRFGSSRTRRRQGRRRRVKERDMGVLPMLVGNINNSFAVVKKSSDPYNDFRTSMVEMIVERQIFAAKDLEKLLQCFLSLNSHQHHKIIVEVFTEIWEALFSNWC